VLFLIALVGAVIVALLVWRAMNAAGDGRARPGGSVPRQARPAPPRVSGPDDDPEFLRQLDERVRRPEDPDTA
jgi:hypothetical protein